MSNLVDEKKVVRHICKYCASYVRKNAKVGRCELFKSTRKVPEGMPQGNINRNNNWTCEKWTERK